jgi:hypothetical protein
MIVASKKTAVQVARSRQSFLLPQQRKQPRAPLPERVSDFMPTHERVIGAIDFIVTFLRLR